jgi:flagellar basal-body rod protein FlgG
VIRSLYTAATGMDAQSLKLDVISNNLANASTTGFKKVRAEFSDLLSETLRSATAPDPRGGSSPQPLQVGLGVRSGATTRTFSQGDLTQTQGPLDLAIGGEGFFRVQRTDGSYAYTRAGNLRVDANGHVTTQNGELLDPEITVPAETTSITITQDGIVSARVQGRDTDQQLGHIELHRFPNPGGLEAIGGNLLIQTPASGEPVASRPGELGTGSLQQGYLEGSNVKAVEEMIEMISTQRAYELNSKVIQTADQMLQRLTNLR